jgi:hypothetical protein
MVHVLGPVLGSEAIHGVFRFVYAVINHRRFAVVTKDLGKDPFQISGAQVLFAYNVRSADLRPDTIAPMIVRRAVCV